MVVPAAGELCQTFVNTWFEDFMETEQINVIIYVKNTSTLKAHKNFLKQPFRQLPEVL